MSPKLADEARAIKRAARYRKFPQDELVQRAASQFKWVSDAARRELLRRSLFGGKG